MSTSSGSTDSPQPTDASTPEVDSRGVQDENAALDSSQLAAAPVGQGDVSTEEVDQSKTLAEAVAKLGLELDPRQLKGVDAYCKKLWRWNTKINLTRHTNYDLFARRDLMDSMRLAAQLRPDEDVLDVGTGGGVPGVLLAILRPDLSVSVCDSVAKKSKVVDDIVQGLKLPVAVHASRVQDVVEDLRFHSLVTRAVGSLSQLLNWLQDYWISFDRLLAIKGPRWIAERGEARHRGLMADLDLRKVDSYPMPGTQSESVILEITRKPPVHP